MTEREIFVAALQYVNLTKRAGYLDEKCGDDHHLRRRVELLLRAHEKAGGFLDLPPDGGMPTVEMPVISEGPGTIIGRYKLLQQIGEGGMGVVFMAEQREPVVRKVALKIIKPGLDSKEVVARFEAEEQALAMMDHPNIARVLDAGATESGRPFFVMELVKGVPITDYCDQNNLDTNQRLDLFAMVCQAVQHAHQKGVIHRDIKPSNVLVTLHDGVPVVKIIDFGVAKATNQRLTERTLFTRFEQMVGTPMYMSPEQAEMSGLDVDTRTDIYSLGVLLYELLTGTPPFDRERLSQAAYDEVRRIIREEEPPKPSTRISTLGKTRTVLSQGRKVEAKRLSALVRGDLDWIVMKALEKDRTRRYETAKDFATDIRRHIHHEPIDARPPSNLYRLRKFVRRNKTAVATFAAVMTTLIAATIVSTWLAVRAIAAENRAAEEARIARAAEIRATSFMEGLADSYLRGGKHALAEGLYCQLLTIRQSSLGEHHPTTIATSLNVAKAICRQGRIQEALALYHAAVQVLGEDHPHVKEAAKAISGMYVQRMWEILQMRDPTPEESPDLLAWASRAAELNPGGMSSFFLGWVQCENGNWHSAIEAFEHSNQSMAHGAFSWALLAKAYWKVGNVERAHDLFVVASEWVPAPIDHRLHELLESTAEVLEMERPWPSVAFSEHESLEVYDRLIETYPDTAELYYRRGFHRGRLQDWPAAVKDLSTAIELQDHHGKQQVSYLRALAIVQLYLGNKPEYDRLCREALDLAGPSTGSTDLVELCAIGEPKEVDPAILLRIADRALKKRSNSVEKLVCGMAAYRCGQYEKAARVLPDWYTTKTPICAAFRACSSFQLNEIQESQKQLERARRELAKLLPTPDGPQIENPPGGKERLELWCLAHLAIREAELLIEGRSTLPQIAVNAPTDPKAPRSASVGTKSTSADQ